MNFHQLEQKWYEIPGNITRQITFQYGLSWNYLVAQDYKAVGVYSYTE